MRTQRQVVDYSLRRRAVLREVQAGRVGVHEVCDASPYLKSAARFHGEPTELRCPVCRRENLTLVHYIYGDELKQSAGQARTRVELSRLAMALREFQVYVVEVCRNCDWNHLVEQFLLGRDGLTGDTDEESGPDGVGASTGTTMATGSAAATATGSAAATATGSAAATATGSTAAVTDSAAAVAEPSTRQQRYEARR